MKTASVKPPVSQLHSLRHVSRSGDILCCHLAAASDNQQGAQLSAGGSTFGLNGGLQVTQGSLIRPEYLAGEGQGRAHRLPEEAVLAPLRL